VFSDVFFLIWTGLLKQVTRIVRTDGNGRGGIPDLDSDIERDRLKKI